MVISKKKILIVIKNKFNQKIIYCMGYETSVDVVELLLLLLLFVFPVLLLPIVLELASFIAGITDTTFCVGINCELSF